MKKGLVIVFLGIILLTGCSKKIVCTKTQKDSEYTSKDTVTLIQNESKINKESTQVLTFDSKDIADSYYNLLKQFSDNYTIEKETKKIILKSSEIYKEESKKLSDLKQEYINSGYNCK